MYFLKEKQSKACLKPQYPVPYWHIFVVVSKVICILTFIVRIYKSPFGTNI